MDANMLHTQWAQRPDDERFLSLAALHDFNVAKRARSVARGVALDHMRLSASDGGAVLMTNPENGKVGALTHWAFGQLCQRVSAPAGYLRELPSALAVIPLQWSLERAREDGIVLARKTSTPGQSTIDAVTSDTYGRIWDAEMTGALLDNVDQSVWKVPSASYASSNPEKATTLYASDRDCFVCLVDDANPIEVPGQGEAGRLFRGFIARQSEVGAAAFDLFLFMYRYICDNRIIWGMQEGAHLKIRHTSGGPMRFMREARPQLQAYVTASTSATVATIQAAVNKEVGKSEKDVADWLKARGFTQGQSKRAVELASMEANLNPRSIWGVVQGLTSQAHELAYGDERLTLERNAGKLMELVS